MKNQKLVLIVKHNKVLYAKVYYTDFLQIQTELINV